MRAPYAMTPVTNTPGFFRQYEKYFELAAVGEGQGGNEEDAKGVRTRFGS
jgi:hypothetical protein